MRSKVLDHIIVVTVFAALAPQVRLAAQDQEHQKKQNYYVVKDLSTLGGPNSTEFKLDLRQLETHYRYQNSEVREGDTFGVLKLTLHTVSYD